MKMDEWVGRFVRLKKRVENKAGDVFLSGEVMVVTGHHRGHLYLNRPARTDVDMSKSAGHRVTGVNREFDVELLPKKPHEVLKVMLEGLDLLAKSVGGVLTYEVAVDGKKKLDKFDCKKVGMLQSVPIKADR